VVGQPSSKTSFIILSDNAGPSKLAAIKKHNLRMLSIDDSLTQLPLARDLADQVVDWMRKRKRRSGIKPAAKELERREKQA